MSVTHFMSRATNFLLRKLGYQLRSIGNEPSMEGALMRRAHTALKIGTIIDVGASDGRWSKLAHEHFPSAFCFLIEANSFHQSKLQQFKAEHPNSEYQIAAAGDTIGEVYFDASDPLGGLASHTPGAPDAIAVPVTTIDIQVQLRKLPPPYLVKLDTHGFELPILQGASETFKQTALIVIEVYNFQITGDNLKFWEMCAFLEQKGFRPIDLCEVLYRPGDHALWQMDMFFAPATASEFSSNIYQ